MNVDFQKTHHTDPRLLINAGMRFPQCQAGVPLLDTDKSAWRTNGDWWQVTCKQCLRIGLREGRRIGGK